MTRYYMATDGVVTVFRATETREYRSAWISAWTQAADWYQARPSNFGFSAKTGPIPAIEIEKAGYEALVAAKMRRVAAKIEAAKAEGKPLSRHYDGGSPSDSWVRNAEIEPAKAPEIFEEAKPTVSIAAVAAQVRRERAEQADPTKATYLNLTQAYDYLNAELFAGRLPLCLVTLQRKANCRGYFAGGRFVTRDGASTTDEIALNPSTFKARDTRDILSTLAHEMVHLQQHHFGKPGKSGYHNKEWADLMLMIDLKPVSIDQPGKMVGNKVTHEIVAGGWFDRVCSKLIEQGVTLDYVEAWSDEGKAKAAKKLKVKYSCPECGSNCWAKPDASFICGDCEEAMEAEEG